MCQSFSHSPFVIQSLDPGELISLDQEEMDDEYSGQSIEDIAEDYMGIDIPELNLEYLIHSGEEIREKAENLYKLLNLGNIPTSPSDKDRRYRKRSEAKNNAIESLNGWKIMKK